ncbi:MAG: hypothetical protein KC766_32390 [Myxococcales bacterium]|nr:hypothetical protein [Myxococcales bacterium]
MSNDRYQRARPWLIASPLLLILVLGATVASGLSKSFTIGGSARGSGSTSSRELSSPVALSGVNLYFRGDDHEIKRIGLWQAPSRLHYSFSDRDGGDKFVMGAHFKRVAANVLHEASRNDCRITCSLPIHAEKDKVFVLAGFDLANRRGEDRNVREVGIVPELHAGRIKVTFGDDSGFDFTARVQYLLLPKDAVRALETYTTTDKQREHTPRFKAQRVIQGFHVRFTNGDHHLGDFTIWGSLKVQASMRDKNTDDPMRGEVRLVVLR